MTGHNGIPGTTNEASISRPAVFHSTSSSALPVSRTIHAVPGSALGTPGQDPGPSYQHRSRLIKACIPCHKNKRRCDRVELPDDGTPCNRCVQLGLPGLCHFSRRPDPTMMTFDNGQFVSALAGLDVQVLTGNTQPAAAFPLPAPYAEHTFHGDSSTPYTNVMLAQSLAEAPGLRLDHGVVELASYPSQFGV